MPDTLEYEDDHGQWKRVPIVKGTFRMRTDALGEKLDALEQRVKKIQFEQASKAPALNANVRQVLRTADDDMKPLRRIVARIVSERSCDCGWPKAAGDENTCYCKECDIR